MLRIFGGGCAFESRYKVSPNQANGYVSITVIFIPVEIWDKQRGTFLLGSSSLVTYCDEILFRIIRPFHQRSAPGKSTAKSSQHNLIAFVQLLFPFP